MSSSLLFTPPTTKSNAEKKACCCDWGDKCSEFKTFFDKNKRELGQVVEVRYSNTCKFHNFLHAAAHFLHIPQSQQREWKTQYDKHVADKTNNISPAATCPRITIVKFHFPSILALTTTQWTTPLTREKIETLECYIGRDPPPQQDRLLIYNHKLGSGQKEPSDGKKLFRIAPCASKADVTAIAAKIQSEGSTEKPSSLSSTQTSQRAVGVVGSIVKCRHNKNIEMTRIRLEMEEEEMQQRTTEQWKDVVTEMKSEIDEKNAIIAAKEAEVERLLELQRLKDDEIAQLKGGVEKHRKRVRRTQTSLSADAADERIEGYCEVVWEKFLTLTSNAGGISRLTIFNDEWHANHPDAARLLWGYNSWKETKLYVNVFFNGEVDVNYDPSANIRHTKEGDLKMPNLTPFERCVACRMFFHLFAHEQIIALCFDKHRTRIGQILKEWAPKWASVGIDLSCLDITSDYLFKEVPDRNINLGKPRLVFVDGKDWLISPKQNDTAVEKMSYSSKTEKTSARGLTFSSAGGLVFEWSPLFGGRGGERKIVEFMGSLGPSNAPIADWEDVAGAADDDDDDLFWTALSDVMTAKEFDETVERLEEGDQLVSNGLLDIWQ